MKQSADSVPGEDVNPNQVFLRGRLAAEPQERVLPSGDTLTLFRLTVPRPADDRVRVDSLDCSSVAARVRRSLFRASPGDLIELTGSQRRRFWRSPSGPASRYTVDATSVKVTRAGRRVGASRARKRASA